MKKICVAISCYNQETYIGACISHLLAQKCSCEVKIILCDDASTDRTRDVILGIMKTQGLPANWSFEDCSNGQNMGMPENTKRILRLLMESGADYGCILEGDDYWISPEWLTKHGKPMDEDETVSMSNNYLLIYQQDENLYSMRTYPDKIHTSAYVKAEYQAEDNYTGNFSSSLYRISALDKISKEFLQQPYVDDWFVNLLMAQYGKIASVKEPLSVYRVHSQSVWNGRDKDKVESREETSIAKRIRFVQEHYPGRYEQELAIFSERWDHLPRLGKIYCDTGNGFNENESVLVYMDFDDRVHFHINADLGQAGVIKNLRYDPVEGYQCTLANMICRVDGSEVKMKPMNGKKKRNQFIFETYDPNFCIEKPKNGWGNLKTITIEGDIYY